MATTRGRADRRVERTRQMLQQAFREVVQEKGFAATSVQDITERANVNRGTFYLHFADKYMLLDTFVREDIQRRLASSLPSPSGWNKQTLRLLVQTLLHHFERKYQHQRHIPQAIAPLIERAVHEEITCLLLTWLKQYKNPQARWPVPKETIARVTGWAIFGTILEWSQEESSISAEQMTEDILRIMTEGVTRLAPCAQPE